LPPSKASTVFSQNAKLVAAMVSSMKKPAEGGLGGCCDLLLFAASAVRSLSPFLTGRGVGGLWPPFFQEERRCEASATVRGSRSSARLRALLFERFDQRINELTPFRTSRFLN
jgi:hypothetical protein